MDSLGSPLSLISLGIAPSLKYSPRTFPHEEARSVMPIVNDTAPPAPSRFPLLAIVSVLAFAAACHRSPALTREYALQALAANKHFIVAAHHRSLGITLIGTPDPHDTTFKVDH